LALTSPAGCGRSVSIVHLRTKTTDFFLRKHDAWQDPDKHLMHYMLVLLYLKH
jgi:hypothetical protein